MIAQRTIISGSTGHIFAIVSRNDSVMDPDDRYRPLFSDISRDVAMVANFVEKKWQTPLICRFGIPKRNGISLPQCAH